MDLQGKIIQAGEPQSGTSARTGQQWMSQEFVLETYDQYPRKCAFRVFGQDRLQQYNLAVGKDVTISFEIDAREYNGRWYNDIRVWRVQDGLVLNAAQGAPVAMPSATTAQQVVAPQPVAASAPASAPAASAQPAPAPAPLDEDLPF